MLSYTWVPGSISRKLQVSSLGGCATRPDEFDKLHGLLIQLAGWTHPYRWVSLGHLRIQCGSMTDRVFLLCLKYGENADMWEICWTSRTCRVLSCTWVPGSISRKLHVSSLGGCALHVIIGNLYPHVAVNDVRAYLRRCKIRFWDSSVAVVSQMGHGDLRVCYMTLKHGMDYKLLQRTMRREFDSLPELVFASLTEIEAKHWEDFVRYFHVQMANGLRGCRYVP